MALISVDLIKDRAVTLLFLSTLCSSIGWASSRRQSSPFGIDGSMDPMFDVPSAGFDPESSMFSEPALPMYPSPRASGNRSPFGGGSPSFPGNSPPFGGSRSPFGNPPSSSSPFGGPGPEMSPPWERSMNSMSGEGGGPLPSSPFGSRPRLGMPSFGASSPKLNGGFTPPWRRGMSSRSSPNAFPVDSNLMGIDDMGPSLGRRHRKIKPEKPSLFPRDRMGMGGGMGGGPPEDLGMEPFREDEGMNFGSPFPMMELPGYEEMLMGGRGMLQNRGRRPNPFGDDLGGGYAEDADEPFPGEPSPYGNPAPGAAGVGKRAEKKHHRPRNQKYPDQEAYTGSGMSYGPYGYQDPDFDQSLIEELEMMDQQGDQADTEEGGPNDEMYAAMDENNSKQFNQPLRNSLFSHMSRGEKNVKPTKKPQANSADALEEEVVFGNVRRSVGENKISNNAAAATGNGNGTPSGKGPSEVINGLRPSPPKTPKGFIRGGGPGGRMSNNGNNNMDRAQQPKMRVGGRRPPMTASEEEESVIRGTLPSPGQLAPGRNLYPGLDSYAVEPQRNRGMYPLTELNRRRRNALAENYYGGDTEAYPILRPLPVPITPKYLYGDQPVYTYDLPGLVFNRMKRQGGPEQYLVQPGQGGMPRQGPRRVIRRIIRRRPLMERERRLRQQLQPEGVMTDDEELSYENTGEIESVTPVVTQSNDTATNTNTTETPTTTPTSTTVSTTVTTEAPHEKDANPKPEAPEAKPVKTDHKQRKRETYN